MGSRGEFHSDWQGTSMLKSMNLLMWGVIPDLAFWEIGHCLIWTGVAPGFSLTQMGALWSANAIPPVSAQAEGNLVNHVEISPGKELGLWCN